MCSRGLSIAMQLLIALMLLIPSGMELPRVPVDIIEFNSIVSVDNGCPVVAVRFSQVILWRWYPQHGAFHVLEWHSHANVGRLRYIHNHWELTIYNSGLPRYIAVSPHMRTTHTLCDPEVLDRRLWPEKVRDRAPR